MPRRTRVDCAFISPDGDRAFANWRDEGSVQLAEGEGNLSAALGKAITGSYTYTRVAVRPAAESTFQGYATGLEDDWKLPTAE